MALLSASEPQPYVLVKAGLCWGGPKTGSIAHWRSWRPILSGPRQPSRNWKGGRYVSDGRRDRILGASLHVCFETHYGLKSDTERRRFPRSTGSAQSRPPGPRYPSRSIGAVVNVHHRSRFSLRPPNACLARRIELTHDVTVQRPQHADARMHQEVATFGGADYQATGSRSAIPRDPGHPSVAW
jgi:hypothetical protein